MCWRCWWWRFRAAAWSRRSSRSARLLMAWRRAAFCSRLHSVCGLRRGFRGPLSNWRTRLRKSPAEIGMCVCRPRGHDEVSVLARSFNHMTEQLEGQRDRLVQSERVAAWRELARRLAHELKNPLFPLQLTVENLVRARELPPAEFDEVFRESTRRWLRRLRI